MEHKDHIHLIGIGGSGQSAIARILLEMGYTVSGSDRTANQLTQSLQKSGAQIFIGHAAEQITGANLVIRSSAIPDDNPEVLAAGAAGIPVYKRSQFLGKLLEKKATLAIAGTHGKTTTTAMLAWMLVQLEKDPSYIIGGVSLNLRTNAHAGKGDYFVIEADEYDYMFLGLNPDLAVVTYMEHDHPNCFPTMREYRQAFIDFVKNLKPGGVLLVAKDQPETLNLVQHVPPGCKAYTFGAPPVGNYTASNLTPNRQGGFSFNASFRTNGSSTAPLARVDLQVPGEHNVRNALAALAAIHQLGEDVPRAAKALGEFKGTGRRFEIKGEWNGIILIDDYAHHPTEISATLAAARSRYPLRRIWAVWQPHTYTRTMVLLPEFAQSFTIADRVIVTEIYGARENNTAFSSSEVVRQMSHPAALFLPEIDQVVKFLCENLQTGDVVLVLSAGDADQINQKILACWQAKKGNHEQSASN